MIFKICKSRFVLLFLLLCSCHTAPHPPSALEEIPSPAPSSKPAQPTPIIAPASAPAPSPEQNQAWIALAADSMASSAAFPLAEQYEIQTPSLNQALYMMRASRYKDAAEIAARLDSDRPEVHFIRAKAQIEAGLCSSTNLQSQTLIRLRKEITKNREYSNNLRSELSCQYAFWTVRALICEQNFSEAANQIERFRQSCPNDKKSARELILILAENISQMPDSADEALIKRLSRFLQSAESGGNAFEASSALYWRYRLAPQGSQNQDALRIKLMRDYPASQMAQWPELAKDVKTVLSASDRYRRAMRMIKHFDYEDARRELADLVSERVLPKSQHDNAEWELARIAMTNTSEPKMSENIYRRIAQENGPRKEEAVFGIARALARQLDYRAALKALDDYISKYPRGKFAHRTLYLQGWYWFDLRENEKARPYLLEYAQKTGDTAVWGFYAQTFIRENRWQEAIDAFEKLKANQNPIVRGKALYWQAYAAHALGRDDEARRRLTAIHDEFPFTYYDILAFQREEDWYGQNFREKMTARLNLKNDPPNRSCRELLPWGTGCDLSNWLKSKTWQEILTLIQHDDIEAARSLYQKNEIALLNEAENNSQTTIHNKNNNHNNRQNNRQNIKERRDTFRHFANLLTDNYYPAWKDSAGSIRAWSKTYPDRQSARQHMSYPQAFAPLVERISAQYGLPRFFIWGIMLQESRFRPYQISSADAIGALQMIPKTATKIAESLNLKYHPETFFDPKVGFPYSAYYMKIHLDMWHNNLTFTAGSYNGGPHRIGPWMMRDKGKTMDFIVEEFSFDESRHYARKVAEHTLRYLYLYSRNLAEQLAIIDMLFPREIIAEAPPSGWGY